MCDSRKLCTPKKKSTTKERCLTFIENWFAFPIFPVLYSSITYTAAPTRSLYSFFSTIFAVLQAHNLHTPANCALVDGKLLFSSQTLAQPERAEKNERAQPSEIHTQW